MRDQAYKSFFRKFKPIIDDCIVKTEVTEKNPEQYTIYEMRYRHNIGMKVAYDNQKLKKHVNTLREICSEIPQSEFHKKYLIFEGALLNDGLLNEKDKTVLRKKVKQQHNTAELFCSMLKTTRNC